MTLFKPGDEVFYAGSILRQGTNAEFHLVDERIVGRKPPASVGGGGIWSDSRVQLGETSIDSPVLPRLGGRALGTR